MASELIGYARTSTADQVAGLEEQHTTLRDHGCLKTFSEHASAVGHRAKLEEALTYLREGDTLVVTKLDRLARNVSHLLDIVKGLEAKGVALRILSFGGEPLNTKGPTGKLTLTMFAAIGEFERALMLERQIAGIAKAKGEGKYKGRVPTAQRQAGKVIAQRASGVKPVDIAKNLKIGRASVFRILAAHKATTQVSI